MSSDSSDDENSKLLREAVDGQFIHDGMFNNSKSTKANPPQHATNQTDEDLKSLPSLRPSIDKDDQFNMLGVTPQFQEYVAKQLSFLLDEKLEKRLKNGIHNSVPRKRKKSGIKLFSSSTRCIKLIKTDSNVPKRPKNKSDSESDIETKCMEVAVKPDDVLNKKDIEHWSTKSKAPVFRYQKTKNGTLTSID